MYELYIMVAAKWLFLGQDTHTRIEYSVKYKFSLSFSFVFVFQFAFELGEDLRGCYASVAERSER